MTTFPSQQPEPIVRRRLLLAKQLYGGTSTIRVHVQNNMNTIMLHVGSC
jgi:hypothetical protein